MKGHSMKFFTDIVYRSLSFLMAVIFLTVTIVPSGLAQSTPAAAVSLRFLPPAGSMMDITNSFQPALIKGLTIYPENPLLFDFIVNAGDSDLEGDVLKAEANKMIKYFLAALTVPEKEMWVNLSPDEPDRIIPEGLGDTEMGRDMLAQDYLLKQLTASLMYPEEELGAEFWERIYERAYEEYGVTDIPVDTFHKVWIVPEAATVYEHEESRSAFVTESRLKVMLEEDYLAVDRRGLIHQTQDKGMINHAPTDIIREIILPEIEHEVNVGQTFANLRQIYHTMILATWYKLKLKNTLLGQVYVDQNKTKGVDTQDKHINQKIYDQYIASFKKGVYDYIKEDYDPSTQEIVPRKYFSGGFSADNGRNTLSSKFWIDSSMLGQDEWVSGKNIKIQTLVTEHGITQPTDQAMINFFRKYTYAQETLNERKKRISQRKSKIIGKALEKISQGEQDKFMKVIDFMGKITYPNRLNPKYLTQLLNVSIDSNRYKLGENFKNINLYQEAIDFFYEKGLSREDVIEIETVVNKESLYHTDPFIRMRGAVRLNELEFDQEAVDVLIKMLMHETISFLPSAHVPFLALEALGNIKDTGVVDPIIDATETIIKNVAIISLGDSKKDQDINKFDEVVKILKDILFLEASSIQMIQFYIKVMNYDGELNHKIKDKARDGLIQHTNDLDGVTYEKQINKRVANAVGKIPYRSWKIKRIVTKHPTYVQPAIKTLIKNMYFTYEADSIRSVILSGQHTLNMEGLARLGLSNDEIKMINDVVKNDKDKSMIAPVTESEMVGVIDQAMAKNDGLENEIDKVIFGKKEALERVKTRWKKNEYPNPFEGDLIGKDAEIILTHPQSKIFNQKMHEEAKKTIIEKLKWRGYKVSILLTHPAFEEYRPEHKPRISKELKDWTSKGDINMFEAIMENLDNLNNEFIQNLKFKYNTLSPEEFILEEVNRFLLSEQFYNFNAELPDEKNLRMMGFILTYFEQWLENGVLDIDNSTDVKHQIEAHIITALYSEFLVMQIYAIQIIARNHANPYLKYFEEEARKKSSDILTKRDSLPKIIIDKLITEKRDLFFEDWSKPENDVRILDHVRWSVRNWLIQSKADQTDVTVESIAKKVAEIFHLPDESSIKNIQKLMEENPDYFVNNENEVNGRKTKADVAMMNQGEEEMQTNIRSPNFTDESMVVRVFKQEIDHLHAYLREVNEYDEDLFLTYIRFMKKVVRFQSNLQDLKLTTGGMSAMDKQTFKNDYGNEKLQDRKLLANYVKFVKKNRVDEQLKYVPDGEVAFKASLKRFAMELQRITEGGSNKKRDLYSVLYGVIKDFQDDHQVYIKIIRLVRAMIEDEEILNPMEKNEQIVLRGQYPNASYLLKNIDLLEWMNSLKNKTIHVLIEKMKISSEEKNEYRRIIRAWEYGLPEVKKIGEPEDSAMVVEYGKVDGKSKVEGSDGAMLGGLDVFSLMKGAHYVGVVTLGAVLLFGQVTQILGLTSKNKEKKSSYYRWRSTVVNRIAPFAAPFILGTGLYLANQTDISLSHGWFFWLLSIFGFEFTEGIIHYGPHAKELKESFNSDKQTKASRDKSKNIEKKERWLLFLDIPSLIASAVLAIFRPDVYSPFGDYFLEKSEGYNTVASLAYLGIVGGVISGIFMWKNKKNEAVVDKGDKKKVPLAKKFNLEGSHEYIQGNVLERYARIDVDDYNDYDDNDKNRKQKKGIKKIKEPKNSDYLIEERVSMEKKNRNLREKKKRVQRFKKHNMNVKAKKLPQLNQSLSDVEKHKIKLDRRQSERDSAELVNLKREVGGIDFDSSMLNLHIQHDGNGIPLPLELQDLDAAMQVPGFEPHILFMAPVNMMEFLGRGNTLPDTPAASIQADEDMVMRNPWDYKNKRGVI